MSEDWMGRAACRPDPSWSDEQRYLHTRLFFPERGDSHAEGKKMCARCPVRDACRAYADGMNEGHGTWGGQLRSRGNHLLEPDTDTQPETIEQEQYVIPNRLSASSIQNYLGCPARWKAEYMDRGRMPDNSAAGLGTVCHEVFEVWVTDGHYQKGHVDPDSVMKGIYDEAYWRQFADAERYDEGLGLCKKWLGRQDWTGREVISAEKQMTFQVPTSKGPIDFVFIIDRLDKILKDDGSFGVEVIDYKSFIRPVQPADLKHKPQVRIYALGVQMMFPELEKVWVSFDLLRYDIVGVAFTKEENRATWKWLCALAEKIVQDDTAEEKLNDECMYCVRKLACTTLQKHTLADGPLGIKDVDAAAQKHYEIERAIKALQYQLGEMEGIVMAHMEREELIETELGGRPVKVTISSQRAIDDERVRKIVGNEVMAQYGKMTMGKLDALLSGNDIDAEKKQAVKALITRNFGSPKIKVETPAVI